jgi:hypothetical protein
MKTKTFISLIAALAVMAALATTAFAQSSVDGYSDNAGQIQTQVAGNTGGGGGNPPSGTAASTVTPVSDSGGSTLPFTGLDVALLVGAGGLLVAAGFGMRRLTRAPDAA